MIIELRLWPDHNQQINHLPAARGFGEGQEREESKHVEQEGDHRAEILSGSAPIDQRLAASRGFGEGQRPERSSVRRLRGGVGFDGVLGFSPNAGALVYAGRPQGLTPHAKAPRSGTNEQPTTQVWLAPRADVLFRIY